MAEPTGIMDQIWRPAPDKQSYLTDDMIYAGSNKTLYKVCDLADEEVHFSKYPIESSIYNYNYDQYTHIPSSPSSLHSSGTFNDFNMLAQNGCEPNAASRNPDQIISNRLLNLISSRFRRGSNYIDASKVVGQYLLGITIQSWCEFFNTSRMMKAPCTRQQLTRRLLANLSYFQGNYLCVSLVLVIYCILTSPLLLIAIAFYLFALYLVTVRSALGKQTRLFNYRLNLQQQYSFLTMFSLPPLWIAGAPSALFWVIGASFFVVGLHASMYANERAMAAEVANQETSSVSNQLVMSQRNSGFKSSGNDVSKVAHSETSLETGNGKPHHHEATSGLRYYNHYATTTTTSSSSVTQRSSNNHQHIETDPPSSPNNYVELMSSSQQKLNPVAGSAQRSGRRNSAASFHLLSNWIPFSVGSDKSSSNGSSAAKQYDSWKQPQRVPEVKVISHNFAGLGKVYEI